MAFIMLEGRFLIFCEYIGIFVLALNGYFMLILSLIIKIPIFWYTLCIVCYIPNIIYISLLYYFVYVCVAGFGGWHTITWCYIQEEGWHVISPVEPFCGYHTHKQQWLQCFTSCCVTRKSLVSNCDHYFLLNMIIALKYHHSFGWHGVCNNFSR